MFEKQNTIHLECTGLFSLFQFSLQFPFSLQLYSGVASPQHCPFMKSQNSNKFTILYIYFQVTGETWRWKFASTEVYNQRICKHFSMNTATDICMGTNKGAFSGSWCPISKLKQKFEICINNPCSPWMILFTCSVYSISNHILEKLTLAEHIKSSMDYRYWQSRECIF